MNKIQFNIAVPIMFAFTIFVFWDRIEWLRVTAICYGIGLWTMGNMVRSNDVKVSGEEQHE